MRSRTMEDFTEWLINREENIKGVKEMPDLDDEELEATRILNGSKKINPREYNEVKIRAIKLEEVIKKDYIPVQKVKDKKEGD